MSDEVEYLVTDVGTPRLPNFDEDERTAPKSAKWIHMKLEQPRIGYSVKDAIWDRYIVQDDNGFLDVDYTEDEGGFLVLAVKDESMVDDGVDILVKALENVVAELGKNTTVEKPRYIY